MASTQENGWRGPDIVGDGIILYLEAGSPNSYVTNYGAIWRDISGNSNNGSLINTPTFSNTNGGIFTFNGSDEYITFVDSGLLPTAGLTVSIWLRTTVANKWIVDKAAGGTTNGYHLSGTLASGLEFYINSTFLLNPASVNITTGAWMLITGTWTPSTSIILYQNITQLGSNTTSIPASINNPSSNLNIARNSTNIDFWNGDIGTVIIYNRALSLAEITQNYNAQKSRFGL
jgi:hypothetical protein